MNEKTIEILKKIKQDKFNFEKVSKHELANEMLKHIGHPDPVVRDDLIYESLAHLFHDRYFHEVELTKYLQILIDDKHMAYDIENKIVNSALTRSFSILQTVILIFVHQRDGIISKDVIYHAFNQFMKYFEQEQILDGYDEKLGWIHTIAHSADLMNQFMKLSWFKTEDIKLMFNSIADKIKQENHLFMYNEEERLVVALKSGIKRDVLTKEFLLDWVDQLVLTEMPTNTSRKVCLKNNIKHLLYALYFSLVDDEKYRYLVNHIKQQLMNFKI